MVQIEERALRALEQHALPGGERAVQLARDVAHHGPEPGRVLGEVAGHGRAGHRPEALRFGELAQQAREVPFRPRGERVRRVEVTDAQAGAPGLVAICEADPTAGRADGTRPLLGHGLDRAVVGQDEMRSGADAEAGTNVEAERFEPAHLVAQRGEVHDHAVADEAARAGVHDPRRHQVEHDGLVAAHDAVSRVRTALIAGDDVGLGGERVDDLALAFIAPLGADHDGTGHVRTSVTRTRGRPIEAAAENRAGRYQADRCESMLGAMTVRNHRAMVIRRRGFTACARPVVGPRRRPVLA